MRESNHNLASANRASIVISNALYDRRAFDSPISTLPLVSSLHHLVYLTATSPRIRDILAVDGGLERLVRVGTASIDLAHAPAQVECTCPAATMSVDPPVASTSSQPCQCHNPQRPRGPKFKAFSAYSKKASAAAIPTAYDRALVMTYTLSLQSLVNVGVRGSEHIRTRVVQAGVLDLAVRVLKGFLAERSRHAQAIVEAQEMAFRAARRIARLQAHAVSLVTAPATVADDVVAIAEIDIEPPLPPVTRTPTPDTAALITDDDAINVQEDREQDAQDAREDADLESSVAPEIARARSATIKSGTSPATELVHAVEEDAMQVDAPESGESDAEAGESDVLPAAPTQMSMTEDPTPRMEPVQLPQRATFEPMPESPQASLVTPSSSSSGSLSFRFREDDVLLVLQLLAYLSKYAHVRTVFHDPDRAYECLPQYQREELETMMAPASCQPTSDPSRNVFALVERFTVRPSSSDRYAGRLPNDLQYWAGVVMRNACRKDESRGGIRQCAYNGCGRFEQYPRQFAKCRRCRKAKYCSKDCQSKAWSSGHRYWCSAKEPSESHSHHRGTNDVRTATSLHESPARGNVTLDEDDDETIEITARPHPRTHVLLRDTLPDMQDDLLVGGPGINDPLRVAHLGEPDDGEEGRFF